MANTSVLRTYYYSSGGNGSHTIDTSGGENIGILVLVTWTSTLSPSISSITADGRTMTNELSNYVWFIGNVTSKASFDLTVTNANSNGTVWVTVFGNGNTFKSYDTDTNGLGSHSVTCSTMSGGLMQSAWQCYSENGNYINSEAYSNGSHTEDQLLMGSGDGRVFAILAHCNTNTTGTDVTYSFNSTGSDYEIKTVGASVYDVPLLGESVAVSPCMMV